MWEETKEVVRTNEATCLGHKTKDLLTRCNPNLVVNSDD